MSEQNNDNTFLGMRVPNQEELGQIGLGAVIGVGVSAVLYLPVYYNVYSTKVLLGLLAVLTIVVLVNVYFNLGIFEPMNTYLGTTLAVVYVVAFGLVLLMKEEEESNDRRSLMSDDDTRSSMSY